MIDNLKTVQETPALQRFAVGDWVAHITLGDGTVTRNDGAVLEVTFDRRYPKDAPGGLGGKRIVQNYDGNWFIRNPVRLFHRGTH